MRKVKKVTKLSDITAEDVRAAHLTILQYFVQRNLEENLPFPVTMIESEGNIEGKPVRVFSFFVLSGRGETEAIEDEEE